VTASTSAASTVRPQLADFMVEHGFDDYASLHHWSVSKPDAFWRAVWAFTGVVGEPGHVAFDRASGRFFPSARLNVAENLLAAVADDQTAIVAVDDEQGRRVVDGARLRSDVAACAAALAELGVTRGDHVVAQVPNGIEAVVTMLAAASIGAVFASTSTDFGAPGVIDRFAPLAPKVAVLAPSSTYGGKVLDHAERNESVAAALPHAHTVLLGADFDDRLDRHRGASARYEPLPFDHPWMVLFSSGTTGPPKGIVHRSGGVLLTHRKEHVLHCDVRAGDAVAYYTTTGWMMWNWLVSVLASGATMVAIDGSPFHPHPTRLFDLVDAEHVTLLGVSAKYLDAAAQAGVRPVDSHDLSSLRTICSTGSPLGPDGFRYVREQVSPHAHLASISGGTDICGCFVCGVPTAPVHDGEIQAAALGMDVAVFDDAGHDVSEPGVAGELVCRNEFPSAPLCFVDDPDGARYRAAYSDRFPGVWAHGDFISRTVHGGFVIHGRSDATLNPGGVRIGTGEIYRVVERIEGVTEALAFALKDGSNEQIALAVRLADGASFDADVIRARIRAELTPRHVPAVVIAVDDLPRTRSGKLVELAVADAVHGRPIRNREALANPEALDSVAAAFRGATAQ
jgi:acetoacetyl-CoA synthetase